MPRRIHVPALRRHAATGQARVLIRERHLYLGQYGSPEAEEKSRYRRDLVIVADRFSPAVRQAGC